MKLCWLMTPMCAVFVAGGATGCVRTHDGSIEPRYAPAIERIGPVPIVALRPIRREMSETLRERPSPPPEPRMVEYIPPPVARSTRRAVPAKRSLSTVSLTCSPMPAAGGRVRVECQ